MLKGATRQPFGEHLLQKHAQAGNIRSPRKLRDIYMIHKQKQHTDAARTLWFACPRGKREHDMAPTA